jgi:hypothetical protein
VGPRCRDCGRRSLEDLLELLVVDPERERDLPLGELLSGRTPSRRAVHQHVAVSIRSLPNLKHRAG